MQGLVELWSLFYYFSETNTERVLFDLRTLRRGNGRDGGLGLTFTLAVTRSRALTQPPDEI